MKRLLLVGLICLCIVPVMGSVQTPAVSIVFTCNVTPAAKCTEYLRLVSDGTGWTAASGVTRMVWVQKITANRLNRIALDQKQFEDTKAQQLSTENAFRLDFPDQP